MAWLVMADDGTSLSYMCGGFCVTYIFYFIYLIFSPRPKESLAATTTTFQVHIRRLDAQTCGFLFQKLFPGAKNVHLDTVCEAVARVIARHV